MAKINYNETEQKLQLLKEDIDPKEIGYIILSAFGTTNTYIKRYREGKGNMFKPYTEGILIKKSLAYQAVDTLQLTETLEAMKEDEDIKKQNARILAVSDGKTLLAYDTREKESYENKVKKMWLDFQFFYPLAGIERFVITEENPADVKAAEKMARLHNEISRYNEYTSKDDLHDLNVFMMRLLFCFFAEDTGIFEKKVFSDYIHRFTATDGNNLAEKFDEIFNVMDQPHRVGLTRVTAQFPYVNGGLFHGRIDIPKMGMRSRKLILESGELNWGDINPDIFGSMMQAVVTPNLRSELGMHYTSVPNIMKVIQPLFLNDLEEAFITAYNDPQKLDELLVRISKIKFFDPACGSGNFLIITYKELRRLEIRIWERIIDITKLRILPFSNISISQFYGIEIDSFAHEIAMLSLWLAEHQMNAEFTKSFANVKIDALPLKNIDTIVQGNACRLNWEEVCPHEPDEEVYVFGNPPYLGSKLQDKEQKEELRKTFSHLPDSRKNNLDYIAIWFYLGTKYIKETNAKVAFVSTNSIVQGEQVGILWPAIFKHELKIDFAHTEFRWNNNAKQNAAVYCVVVGLAKNEDQQVTLFSNNRITKTREISPYLTIGSSTVVKVNEKVPQGLPKANFGSMPRDGGFLILSHEEREELLADNQELGKIIKRYVGADEFINGKKRYCLWIENNQTEIQLAYSNKYIRDRLEKVARFRSTSKAPSTRKYADVPHLFVQRAYEYKHSIIIPSVSSERRNYIPIGYIDKNTVISNLAFALYDAEIWLFGILTSKIHNAWVRAVGGALETRIRYSATLCYNTFPFPDITKAKKEEIATLAEEVLMVREHHTEKTLAEMYDPDKMPQDLRDAHTALDLAVDSCYHKQPFNSDEERLEVLFKLYEKMNKSN